MSEPTEEFLGVFRRLGEGEREILQEVADGLLVGQTVYKPFDLERDGRDFRHEAFQEDRDWLVYRAAEIVRNRKLRNRE